MDVLEGDNPILPGTERKARNAVKRRVTCKKLAPMVAKRPMEASFLCIVPFKTTALPLSAAP
ncbi:hypothetical protein JCM12214_27060 [Geobacillus vulcani]